MDQTWIVHTYEGNTHAGFGVGVTQGSAVEYRQVWETSPVPICQRVISLVSQTLTFKEGSTFEMHIFGHKTLLSILEYLPIGQEQVED